MSNNALLDMMANNYHPERRLNRRASILLASTHRILTGQLFIARRQLELRSTRPLIINRTQRMIGMMRLLHHNRNQRNKRSPSMFHHPRLPRCQNGGTPLWRVCASRIGNLNILMRIKAKPGGNEAAAQIGDRAERCRATIGSRHQK